MKVLFYGAVYAMACGMLLGSHGKHLLVAAGVSLIATGVLATVSIGKILEKEHEKSGF